MASSDFTSQLSFVFDLPPRYGREYDIWNGIKQRCCDPNSDHRKYYLDRGISVCERWLSSFENFYLDMGPRPSPLHTIDRKDCNGNYTPGNCRWATKKEQARNRRNNNYVTYLGQTKTVAEWAELTGINYQTLRSRLKSGWNVADVFTRAIEFHSSPSSVPKICVDCLKPVSKQRIVNRCQSCGCKERERKKREGEIGG